MHIEIRQPELKAMIQQRMATGRFDSIEDVLLDALRVSPEIPADEAAHRPKKNFAQFLLESPLHGSGLQCVREKDDPRPIHL